MKGHNSLGSRGLFSLYAGSKMGEAQVWAGPSPVLKNHSWAGKSKGSRRGNPMKQEPCWSSSKCS